MTQRARIIYASTSIQQINQLTDSIQEIAKKTKVKMMGPVPLKTRRLKHTVRKCPCGDGKASFDKWEMRVHKRLIDLGVNERALRLVMRVPIPENIQIQIELSEG